MSNETVTLERVLLAEVVLMHIEEEAYRDADHLWYRCRECDAEERDDWQAIAHEDDCPLKPIMALLIPGATA